MCAHRPAKTANAPARMSHHRACRAASAGKPSPPRAPISTDASILSRFPRAPQSAARFRAGVFAILNDFHAVNENVLHANGVLMRFLECREIKHDHIGEHSLFNETAMIEPEIGGGQPA